MSGQVKRKKSKQSKTGHSPPTKNMSKIAAVTTIASASTPGRKEMFYLTTHSTHFIYGYMATDIWLRTILIVRKETRCRHIGYSLRLTARVLLYAPSHRQDSTYHGLCYTSRGIFGGIPCTNEEDTEVVLKTFLKEELDIQEADNNIFQNVHRLRPRTDGKPRSIIARFNRFSDHDSVYKAVP